MNVNILKKIMREKNITQSDLSRMSGIHLNTISRIMTGKQSPKYKSLEQIALALEMNVAELFGIGSWDFDKDELNVIIYLIEKEIECVKDIESSSFFKTETIQKLGKVLKKARYQYDDL